VPYVDGFEIPSLLCRFQFPPEYRRARRCLAGRDGQCAFLHCGESAGILSSTANGGTPGVRCATAQLDPAQASFRRIGSFPPTRITLSIALISFFGFFCRVQPVSTLNNGSLCSALILFLRDISRGPAWNGRGNDRC
jgi:hypothetical protein